jgi:hypothetical protein
MYETYKDEAAIYLVYILEAHPVDGGKTPVNEKDGIKVNQPKTYEERVKVAGDCIKDLKLALPCLVDDMQNSAQKGYAGWPDRIYVIDAEGKVAYKGEPGPRGFKPADAADALKKLVEGK